jgi:hypothetical protein
MIPEVVWSLLVDHSPMKLFKVRRQDLPCQPLPSELWLWIFGYLREADDAFDTSPIEPAHIGIRPWENQAFRARNDSTEYVDFSKRSKARHSIILVSRQFYRLAVEILYEYVILRDPGAVRVFAGEVQRDFDRFNTEPTSAAQSKGSLVKFLSIDFQNDVDQHPEWPASEIRSIAAAFRLCENLELVEVGPYRNTYEINLCRSISREILANGAKIRYFRRDDDPISFREISDRHINTIEVINLPVQGPSSEIRYMAHPPGDESICSFPRLHTLVLSSQTFPRWLTRCDMPVLRRLTLPANCEGTARRIYCALYRKHGKNIWALDMHNEAEPDLASVLEYFPNIRELNMNIRAFYSIYDHFPHALHGIGIFLGALGLDVHGGTVEDMMLRMVALMKHLLVAHSGTLEYVRLVKLDISDFSSQVWSKSHLYLWKKWAAEWKEKSIRFGFQDGKPIEEALKGYDIAL